MNIGKKWDGRKKLYFNTFVFCIFAQKCCVQLKKLCIRSKYCALLRNSAFSHKFLFIIYYFHQKSFASKCKSFASECKLSRENAKVLWENPKALKYNFSFHLIGPQWHWTPLTHFMEQNKLKHFCKYLCFTEEWYRYGITCVWWNDDRIKMNVLSLQLLN